MFDSGEESDEQEHKIDPLGEMDSDFEEEDFNVEHKTMIDKVLKKYTRPTTALKETPQHENQGTGALQQVKNKLKPTSTSAKTSGDQGKQNILKDNPLKQKEPQFVRHNSPKKPSDDGTKTKVKQSNETNDVISLKLAHADSSLFTGQSEESLYISSEEERLPRRNHRRNHRNRESPQKRRKRKEGSTSRERSRSPMKDAEVQTNNTQDIGVQTFADLASPSSPEMSIDIQSNRSDTAPPGEEIFHEEGPPKNELKRMEEKYFKNLQKLLNTVEEANNSIEKPKNVDCNDSNCIDTISKRQCSPKLARRRQTPIQVIQYKTVRTNDFRETPAFNSVPSPLIISPVKEDCEMGSPFTLSSPLLINPVKETFYGMRNQSIRGRPNMQYPVIEDAMIQIRRPRETSQLFASRFADLDSPPNSYSNIPNPPHAFRDRAFRENLEEPFNLPITPPLTSRCPTIWKDGYLISESVEALSPMELEARIENAYKLKHKVHKIDRQFGIRPINYVHTDDQGMQTSFDFDSCDDYLDEDYGKQNSDKEVQTTLTGQYRSKTLLLDHTREVTLDPTKYIPQREEQRKSVTTTELDIFKDKFRAKPMREISIYADQEKERRVRINQFPVKREDEYCRVKRRQIDQLEGAFDFMDLNEEPLALSQHGKIESESDTEEPQEEPIVETKRRIPSLPLSVAPEPIPVLSSDEGQQKPVKTLIKRFDSFEKKDKSLEDIRMTPPQKTKWDHAKKESRKMSPSPIKENQVDNPRQVSKPEMFPAPKSRFDTTDDEFLGEKADTNFKKQSPSNVRVRKEMFETKENHPSKAKDENNQTVIIRKESAGLKDFLKKNPRQAVRKYNEKQLRPPAGFNSSSEQS